jgi:hypothetical protein
MPCRSDEEEAQIPEPPNPVTPAKQPLNDGAGYDNSDAEISLTQSDEEEEEHLIQKRKRVIAEYELVKRWVTGERAVQVSTLICICGRRPALGIRHERACRTPFIAVLCGIGASA